MGLRRLPFGITLRNSKYIDIIKNYEYNKSLIDVEFSGTGNIARILLNDSAIKNTLQVPESMLKKGRNHLLVEMNNKNTTNEPLLISSTLKLDSVILKNHQLLYIAEAFGKNVLVFKIPKTK